MASNNGSNRGRHYVRQPKQVTSKLACAPCTPGDEQEGGFSRAALLKMDERFCERMQRAVERASNGRDCCASHEALVEVSPC